MPEPMEQDQFRIKIFTVVFFLTAMAPVPLGKLLRQATAMGDLPMVRYRIQHCQSGRCHYQRRKRMDRIALPIASFHGRLDIYL